MTIKSGIAELVGRRITAVVVKDGDRSPRQQIFLVLDGNQYYEIHGNDINSNSGLDKGDADAVLRSAGAASCQVFR